MIDLVTRICLDPSWNVLDVKRKIYLLRESGFLSRNSRSALSIKGNLQDVDVSDARRLLPSGALVLYPSPAL